jgi:hypothetical protein
LEDWRETTQKLILALENIDFTIKGLEHLQRRCQFGNVKKKKIIIIKNNNKNS